MSDEVNKTVEKQNVGAVNQTAPQSFRGSEQSDQRGFGRRKNTRKGSQRDGRVKPEFDQKILTIRRVARVAAGGRRFNFSVALVAGNRKGSVGVGVGKANDTSLAIDKAMKNAKKNMLKVPLTKTFSIPHPIYSKYSSARVMIMPAPGKGIVAGSAVRNIVELCGMKDVTAKIISPSKNKLNIARATVEAFRNLYRTINKKS